jgi:NodT family efflux transporter outer membrane factor (OMF) lipoprotein
MKYSLVKVKVKVKLKVFILLALVTLPSCTTFETKRAMNPEGAMPDEFSEFGQGATYPDRWWESFESEELSGLVDQALSGNLTLQELWARLRQSQAIAVQSRSGLYPQLDLEMGAGVRRQNQDVPYTSPGAASTLVGGASNFGSKLAGAAGESALSSGIGSFGSAVSNKLSKQGQMHKVAVRTEDYSLGLAASYEVDVWGRIRSGAEAASLDSQSSRYEVESAAMTVAAQVAEFWFLIREQQMNRAVLAKQLKTNQTYLELVELRFRKSLVTALDVYQQRQKVAGVEARIPLAESQESVLRHGLAILLGEVPTADLGIGDVEATEVELPPLPATGLPVQLLEHRPDIQSAWLLLRSADYRVAEAEADRLPAIRLTGGVGYQSGEWNDLFESWFTNLAGSLTQPLFDGYRRKAEVERTKAVVDERLAAYRLTVLTAIQEVEDALVQEQKEREHIAALKKQVGFAQEGLNRAREQYLKGLVDYLPVLTQLTVVQDLELDLIRTRRELLVYRVNLYRALGGVWARDLEAASVAADSGDGCNQK